MGERTIQDLKMKQALPLEVKVLLTKDRIRQWVNEFGEDGVYVSFCAVLRYSYVYIIYGKQIRK